MHTEIIRNMDLRQIAESGQCFRWNEIETDKYGVIALGKYLEISQQGDCFEFACTDEEFEKMWRSYLDLDTDYGALMKKAPDKNDEFLTEAFKYGSGIRILRQDFFETFISFIISQNNNIPRIRKNIEGLCERFGEPVYKNGELKGYSFPPAEVLAGLTVDDLKGLSLGYRDRYIICAAQWYIREKDGEVSRLFLDISTEEKKKILKGICGVGEKVANCVILFGLHGMDRCPIDTWIKKLISEDYGGDKPRWMESEYAGLYQQYAFYYKRSL